MKKWEWNSPVLQQLVQNVPLEYEVPRCPECSSLDLFDMGGESTLVGYMGTGPNPNHRWDNYKCNGCQLQFTREECSGNIWYTKNSLLLKGVPSCIENYIYTCKCGGHVTRHIRDMNGKETNTKSYSYKKDSEGKEVRINHFRTFYSCDKCNTTIEVDEG